MVTIEDNIHSGIFRIIDRADTKQRYRMKLYPRLKMRTTIKDGKISGRIQILISTLRQQHRNEISKR